MVSPAVMFIEMAADSLRATPSTGITPPDWLRESQRRELHSFGESRARATGATGLSDDFCIGYELGLQTARALLATNPAAVINKVQF